MKKNSKEIAIYSRKSRFTGKGESIGNQIEMCKEYILRTKGMQAAEQIVVYEDEGFSGGNTNRPAFKEMMADAKAGKICAIVVYRLDRISRNIADFAALIEELSRQEIDFVSIRESFDTKSPMGKAMMYIASIFSQLERETIAERIRDNMHELAKTGRWLGGTTPTGFASEKVESITVDGKARSSFQLKIVPEELEIVRTIFDVYLKTNSLTKTEAELIRQNIKTKMGRDYNRFSIKAILQNPVYLVADEGAYDYFVDNDVELFSERTSFDSAHGIMAYNRTDQEKGRATKYLPMNQWIVAVGAHPGTIPSKKWIRVQESLERNKNKSYRKPRRNEALLTGVIYCSCGSRMFPRLTDRMMANGTPICTYICDMKNRSRKERCDRRNVNSNILDAAVLGQLRLLTEDESEFMTKLEQGKKFYITNCDGYDVRLADLREERVRLEKKMTALIDSLADVEAASAKRNILQRIENLDQEMKEIGIQIDELEELSKQYAFSELEFDVLRNRLCSFASICDELTLEEKRMTIQNLVRRVVWDGQFVHLYLFGSEDGDIEFPDPPVIEDPY